LYVYGFLKLFVLFRTLHRLWGLQDQKSLENLPHTKIHNLAVVLKKIKNKLQVEKNTTKLVNLPKLI